MIWFGCALWHSNAKVDAYIFPQKLWGERKGYTKHTVDIANVKRWQNIFIVPTEQSEFAKIFKIIFDQWDVVKSELVDPD